MPAQIANRDSSCSVLLATDLSVRSDRALDRAVQLAQEWEAGLVALNVLDHAAYPDQALAWASGATDDQLMQVAKRQLAHDLGPMNASATLRLVRSGDVPTAIRNMAASVRAGLVVIGGSSIKTLGRSLLGSTAENLARTLPEPLLVVRKRTHGGYRRIMVATDFSESSRHALLTAARFFPGRDLILYHADSSNKPMSINAVKSSGVHTSAEKNYATFMEASALPSDARVQPVLAHGGIESVLTRYVREHDIDLVVMGNRGASGLMGALLGSTAAKLLDWLPCDILRVREPRPVE